MPFSRRVELFRALLEEDKRHGGYSRAVHEGGVPPVKVRAASEHSILRTLYIHTENIHTENIHTENIHTENVLLPWMAVADGETRNPDGGQLQGLVAPWGCIEGPFINNVCERARPQV